MTLQEVIAIHHAAQPAPEPIARNTVLTDRGHVAVAVFRLSRLLATLEPDDRAYALELLAGLAGAEPITA